MIAYLVVREGSKWRDVYRLTPGQVMTIGRAPTNRIVLHDEVCSRYHCEVFQNGSAWKIRDLQSRNGSYSGAAAYARAKRGLMILTEHWARQWGKDGVVVNAMHPGWADTPGVQSALPAFYRLTRTALRSPAQGADTIVWLAAASEAARVTGKFWLDRQQHPSHVFRRTRETPAERERLLEVLRGYLDATRADTLPRRRSR